MANRRMFSKDVVSTDHFMDMPTAAQCLYFHLGMNADDDGFVANPRQVIKLVNCNNDDVKVLFSKGYIIPFESGIFVIRHWKENNRIRSDRYTETKHLEEKALLCTEGNVYNVAQNGIPNGNQVYTTLDTQDRLGKDSIGKGRLESDLCPEPEQPSPDPSGILLPLVDGTDYDVPLSKIEKWAAAYPAVDVRQQLQIMIAWLDANPKRRKTKKGIDRFINTWLSREQDRGGTFRNGISQQSEPTSQGRDLQAEYDKMYDRYLSNREPSPDDPFQ